MSGKRPTAFITGASAGIGAACVKAFLAAGWNVAAGARRLDRVEALKSAAPPEAAFLPLALDVTDEASVRAAFERTREKFGRLDALVNNAGAGAYGRVADLPVEAFRACMDVNYLGVVRCTQAALPLLRAGAQARGRAGIVMVSSIVGRRAFAGSAAYCATKFALEGLSEALRLELKPERIFVSVVNPSVTNTEFFESADGTRPPGYLPPTGGMSAEAVARAILAAAKRPKRNRYLSAGGKALLAVNWLSPKLADAILAKFLKG